MEKKYIKPSISLAPAGSRDPMFDVPYIDVDEWRDEPVRHRYVHGGFEGTETRFSMYFPPPERYEGRFFQPLMAVPGIETAATLPAMQGYMISDSLPFAISSGAYLAESNQGRTVMFTGEDFSLVGYRASAAVARLSRVLAAEMYGPHRPYGYVYGGSGGAYKTIGCIENCPGVWDGAVPFVMPTPMSIPNYFTVQAYAMRVLKNKLDAIVDALEPGGSGDPYSGLSIEEREALAEVTRFGFPPRSWFYHKRIALGYTGVFAMFLDYMMKFDPEYFKDFWTAPGYLGANPPESLLRARVEHKTVITKVVKLKEAMALGLQVTMSARLADMAKDMPAGLEFKSLPEGDLQGATVTLTSGAAAGHVFYTAGVIGGVVMISFGEQHFRAMTEIKPGDEVQIDNLAYLASQTYHRHQVPPPEYNYYVWDQYRVGGKPLYPQRPNLLNFGYFRSGSGTGIMTGRFGGKMIVVQCLMDEAAYAWSADWYRRRAQATFGESLDDHFRLWFVDHALHTTPVVRPDDRPPVITTRVVPYRGAIEQALRDLSAWVEKGYPPPPSTVYRVVDGQVQVPATAAERRGIQPVVTIRVNGSEKAEVTAGESVEFTAVVEAPPDTGTIVAAEWDFEGTGEYPISEEFDEYSCSRPFVALKRTYSFARPGTYFPALRVTSHRQSDKKSPFCRIQNIGRVRVIVR